MNAHDVKLIIETIKEALAEEAVAFLYSRSHASITGYESLLTAVFGSLRHHLPLYNTEIKLCDEHFVDLHDPESIEIIVRVLRHLLDRRWPTKHRRL
jgi:hypothetical protein